jgi:hypothetical protein
MPFKLWVEHYTQGRLAFKKWGHIDRISDYPAEFALFIDFDSHKFRSIPKINSTFRAMGLSYLALRISRTKRGLHYAFILQKKLTTMERVCAEAILGDDPMRAAMNFARARNAKRMPKFWKQRWNIFYDYKLVNK